MKLIKKILIALLVIIAFLFMTCEPSDPYYESDNIPYMSDLSVHEIPQKVYAKGKPQKVKKKTYKGYTSLGKYTLTAYCGCFKCCGKSDRITASGKKAKANHTIAVDTKKIPLGTVILINGNKYVVEDTGGAIKGKKIDIFFSSHSEALEFGRQKAYVYKQKTSKLKSTKGITKYASNNTD